MADANGLVQAMKRAAMDANESTKPVHVYFGTVETVSPLTINVEQKMVLAEAQLILTRNVTDYEAAVTVDWESESALSSHQHELKGNTENGGEPEHNHPLGGSTGEANLSHAHAISGKRKIKFHNALNIGEEVILLRQQGGQKFVVVDRIGVMT